MMSTRYTLATAGVAAILTVSGCGAGDETTPATATGSVEDLASQVNCQPKIQTDAAEIRQAVCENGGGRFILATFATDQGQRDWFDLAKDYGGHYLVGTKWVAVGGTEMMTTLRGQIGGTIRDGLSHHSGSGGGDVEPHHDNNG